MVGRCCFHGTARKLWAVMETDWKGLSVRGLRISSVDSGKKLKISKEGVIQ